MAIQIPRQVGHLTVLQETGDGWQGYFDCRCSCGNTCRVWYKKLVNGTTTSCGCQPTREKPDKVY